VSDFASRRTKWLLLAVLAAVLAAVLVFLYVKTKSADSSGYFENVALLRQLKQLDAQWELDVLKAKLGTDSNYDSLVHPLADLNELRGRLAEVLGSAGHTMPVALVQGNEAFAQAIREKTRLIEHFKSHNAVLRNSSAFLPTAAVDVRDALDRVGSEASRRVAARVNDILLHSLVYSDAPSADEAGKIESELASVGDGSAHSAEVVESHAIFAAHVRTLLREQPVVDSLLTQIAAVPTAARIDDLDNLLGLEQRRNAEQDRKYRQYLLIFATAMAALLLYVAVSLIRSHAVINRVNKDLVGANATLEHRVEERTSELRVAQDNLVNAARQAGMAEIATNVLHNVGNVLNSVNISAGLVGSHLHASKARGLAQAVGLLDEHAQHLGEYLSQDPKGKLLPGYLRGVSQALEVEQHGMLEELAALSKSVDHIKEIVATQQSYAGASSMVESARVDELIDDALRISAGTLGRKDVEVVRQIAELPSLWIDRHRLMQILVNLLSNARHALDAGLDHGRRITVQAEPESTGKLRIRVSDTGEGIAADHLERIFSHGFTTRKNGHGFGLHSCVIAAQEMGGTLRAHSEGPGCGSTFTLSLPMNIATAGP
jgi:two-component system NtrC family sensor kinase